MNDTVAVGAAGVQEPPPTPQSSQARRESIAQALTFEIDEIRARDSSAGWTPWALAAATAGAGWTLLTLFEQQHAPPLIGVIKWSVIFVVLVDCLGWLRSGIAPATRSKRDSGRYTLSSKEFGPGRLAIVNLLALSLAILYAVHSIDVRHRHFEIAINITYAITAASAILALVLSFVGFAFPADMTSGRSTNWVQRLATASLYVVHAAAAWATGSLALRDRAEANVQILKAAALVLAIQLTVKFLLNSAAEAPLIQSLCDIRRRLLLGQTTIPDALADLELATSGLRASDVLQKYIGAVLGVQEQIRAELRAGASEVAQLRGLLEKAEKATPDEAIAGRKAMCDGIAARVKRVELLGSRYQREQRRFEVRAAILAGMSSRQQEIVAPIRAQFAEGTRGVSEEMAKFRQAIGDATSCETCPARAAGGPTAEFPCTQRSLAS